MLKAIDDPLLDRLCAAAPAGPRRRRHPPVPPQGGTGPGGGAPRGPDSYVCPHKHEDPDKVEVFLCLRGRAAVLAFDDAGRVAGVFTLSPAGPTHGAEVPPRTWHTVLALEPGTVLYEVKQGPYNPATDKKFAPWAPAEGAPEAAEYLEALKREA